MSEMNSRTFTRRIFLQQSMTFASLAASAPLFIQRSAVGMHNSLEHLLSSRPGVPEDHVLVVVQLGGGNDGLNTVIPFFSNDYFNARRSIAIGPPGQGRNGLDGALALDEQSGLGLHPSLRGFKELMDEGVASIIQGVGYPNPNRSHFTSMDIWHTANTNATGNGWLGRYLDNTCHGSPQADAAVAMGRSSPLALLGETQQPVNFESDELFRWMGDDLHPSLVEPYKKITRSGTPDGVDPDSQLGFLTRTALDAQVSSDRIREAVARKPLVQYPRTNLARQLQVIGSMIRAKMSTRVYYASMGGYDTHAGQFGQHARLLSQLGDGLNAFYKDLKAQDNSGRVLTVVFSEFGRRVSQNSSNGTDHGAAAPMFMVGDMVRPGVIGDHPSLTDLDRGDLKYGIDFRSVYAGVLEDWMGAPSQEILGRAYRKAVVVKT